MASYEETIYILGVLAFCAFVAYLVARFEGERARERERRSRVFETQIEKFGEAGEFVQFAQSEAGLAWLRADSGEARVKRGLLVLTLLGILSLALGVALAVYAVLLAGAVDPSDASSRANAVWWGALLLGLGVGSLTATAVLARLGRAWGVIKEPPL